MSELPDRFVAIDEEGYAVNGDLRVQDDDAGREILSQLEVAPNGALVSRFGGVPVLVEAFDAPLVAQQIEADPWTLIFHYGHQEGFDPSSLRVDEWDRFHGRTVKGVPFVFSRAAQVEFFDLLEEFDDESITVGGKTYEVRPLYAAEEDVSQSDFWSALYREGRPRWDLGTEAEPLKDMLPRLKMIKSRILVTGCGAGHDAARFAREGHVVTAVDISAEAIERARAAYGRMENLHFVTADLFDLDRSYDGRFDVVFDHTLYCAVDPERRAELAKRWWRWLAPGGHLMGVFFVTEMRKGPPFGASEWELRERLRKNFRFLFWGRWKKSIPERQGKELFVYAQKI